MYVRVYALAGPSAYKQTDRRIKNINLFKIKDYVVSFLRYDINLHILTYIHTYIYIYVHVKYKCMRLALTRSHIHCYTRYIYVCVYVNI